MIDELLSNRVMRAFERTEKKMHEFDSETIARLEKACVLNLNEFILFQDLKSLAQSEGKITYEEASSLYAVLGSSPNHFNRQPLHLRIVCMATLKELIQRR